MADDSAFEGLEVIDATSESRKPPPPLTLNTITPTSTAVKPMGAEDDFIDDDDLDETLAERLWGLTEMFPEGVRNFSSGVASLSVSGSKAFYSVARSGAWVLATSFTILVLPLVFESERAQMEEQQQMQQKQILLGPNAAAASGMMGGMPSVQPPSLSGAPPPS